MTVERAKELLPIIKAYSEGKEIETCIMGEWMKLIHEPLFDSDATYRIKPTDTDNDITYAKELIRELLLADTRNGSDWTGYLVDLEERAKKFIEE